MIQLELSDAQRVILAAAAARDDGSALPLPPSLKARGAAATAILQGLVTKGLLTKCRVPSGARPEMIWREAGPDGGERFGLTVTAAGREAIGVEDTDAGAEIADEVGDTPAGEKAMSANFEPKVESKQALIVALMRRPAGATLDELMATTGWQRHTVRGAIAGALKKKLGLAILSEKRTSDGARIYRIPDETSPGNAEPEPSTETADVR